METSDSDNLNLVTNSLISIFQNFIKVNETTYDYLKKQREMIVDFAIKMLRFYYQKGDTFEMDDSYLDVIMALSTRCKQALQDIIVEACKDNFFSVKPKIAKQYVNAFLTSCPEEATKIIVKWINDKVIVKDDEPKSWGRI